MISTLITTALLLQVPPPTSLKIQVDGEGYLRFLRDGRTVYAKDAELVLRNGVLSHVSGPSLLPNVRYSGDIQNIEVALDGEIRVITNGTSKTLGRIVLATFADDVRPIPSSGFYVAADRPSLGNPGEGALGVIRSNSSVVKVTNSTVIEKKTESPTKPVAEPPKNPVASGVGAPSDEFIQKGGVQIVLNDLTEVDTDNFHLGEIATIYAKPEIIRQLSLVEISSTPPFGAKRIIDRSVLTARIRAAGLDPSKYVITGSSQATITRPGQKIEQEQFLAAALNAATERFGAQVEPVLKAPVPALSAPNGELSLVAERITQSGSVVTVVVAAFVDGKRINSRTLNLVAAKSATKTFKVGDTVNVRVRSGAIVVEATGKVKSIDSIGGTVTVHLETGAVRTGIVGSDGYVEVMA